MELIFLKMEIFIDLIKFRVGISMERALASQKFLLLIKKILKKK